MNMATMQMYCPSLKENVMATITEGKQVASKGGSLRNIIYGVFEGRKCLPKTVKAEVFAQHGFGAESFCADCKSAEGHGCGCGTKNAEYEDCEVCYATVDKGTLNDVQAGRICNECHRMNKYTGGTRTIKTPYNAETLNAENRCSICSGTGHNSKNCPSPTMSICGKCGGSDFISESYYDGQIYCQKCEVFIPNNELKTVKNPKWKEMFGAESFCADCKSAEGHGCGCGTKNAEFLYYYVLNEKGESPADFNTLEEAQAYVANSNEPLEIYERRNRDDEAYKMDKKMNAESFEAEKRDGRDMNLDEIEETYGEGRLCLLCFDGVMERGEMGFGRDATGTIYTCSNCGAREGMGLNAETFEAGSGLGFTINPASIGKGLPTFWAFDVYNDQVNYQTCLTCTQPIDYEIDEDDDFSGVQCKSCESKYEYRDIDNGITDWEKVGYYLIKDAETFEAKVYDPMMQKKIDQNGCEHRYDDGKDAWVLKDADLMGVEDGLSYIEAGVKCGICGQERIGSWAINEKEGFQITKGEEGRMPRFYGFYATENFEAPFGRMPAWKRGQRMWNENHLVWASDSKAVREAIKTAFPEQKFSVRIVNGQYIEVVAKSGTRPADIEQFMRDVKGVAMEELRKIYKDSPEELREKNVEVQAYESVFDAETFEAKSKGKSKCSKCYWDLAVRRNPISGERQFFNQCLLCGKKDFSRGGSAMSDRGFFAEDMPFGVHVKNHKTTSTVFYRRKPFRRFRGNRHKEKAESYAQFMENKLKSNPNRFSYTAEEEDEDDGMMIKEVRLRIDEEGTQFTPTWAIENKIPILYHYDDSSDLEGIIEDMAENAENYAIDHNENYRYGAESFNAEYPQFRNYKGALIERTAKNRAELYSDGWDMTATLYKPRKKGNWILQLSKSHPELGDRYKTEVKNFTDGLNLYIKLSDLSKYKAETKRKE